MYIDLEKAALFSVVGETITICRHNAEIIAFINGKPMPYRMFFKILMVKIFPQTPELSKVHQYEIGNATAELMGRLSDMGVCNLRELIALGVGPKLCFMMGIIIEDVLIKARERSATPSDALTYLVDQIEEHYEAALA